MAQFGSRLPPVESAPAIGSGIEEHVLAHAQRHGEALGRAVAGDETDPRPHRRSRRAEIGSFAGQHDTAGIDLREPEQSAADLLLAGAAQTYQAQHLARTQGQGDWPHGTDPQPGQLQRHALAAGLRANEHLLRRSADDHRHQLAWGGLRDRLAANQPAVRRTATSSATSNTSSRRWDT